MTAISLQQALKSISDSLEISHALAVSPLFSHWSEIVGQRIAQVTRPLSVRDGVLSISVDNNAWAQQLSLLSPRIVAAANREIGTDTISSLRFQVSGTGWSPRQPQPEHPHRSQRNRTIPPPPVDDVDDPELRQVFTRLYNTYSEVVTMRRGEINCSCGSPLPPALKTCPSCLLHEQDQSVARLVDLLRRDPMLLHRERQVQTVDRSILNAAYATLEVELMTAVKVAHTNIRRGQEITPRVRESIETLVVLRTGQIAQEQSQDVIASIVGPDVARTMTQR